MSSGKRRSLLSPKKFYRRIRSSSPSANNSSSPPSRGEVPSRSAVSDGASGQGTTHASGSSKNLAVANLKQILLVLERSTDAFPLLKSPVAAVNACLGIFDNVTDNRDEMEHQQRRLQNLKEKLETRMKFDGYLSVDQSGLQKLAKKLDDEVTAINNMQKGDWKQQLLNNVENGKKLKVLARRVLDNLEEFQLELGLRQELMTSQIRKHVVISSLPHSRAARYTAHAESVPRRPCTPGTREDLLKRIIDWAVSADPQSPAFFWLNGRAGMGKTTVSYTICERLSSQGLLGASYFCSRQLDSRELTLISPTIARQLASRSRSFGNSLVDLLQDDDEVAHAVLRNQFQGLLAKPWKASSDQRKDLSQLVVVIDALDECDDGMQFLQILLDAARAGSLPAIKFLVTSRPDPELASRLRNTADGVNKVHSDLHNEPMETVEMDIRLFLRESLDSSVADDSQISFLARQANGLFIFASTLMQFIQPQRTKLSFHESKERLESLYSPLHSSANHSIDGPSPTKGIDALYQEILFRAMPRQQLKRQEFEKRMKILHTIICTRQPTTAEVISDLSQIAVEDVHHVVCQLYAVMFTAQDRIFTLHASFPDFVLSSHRSSEYACQSAREHTSLSRRCFAIMKESLRFNICDLESSFIPDDEIPDLQMRIMANISLPLSYACRSWYDHLTHAAEKESLLDDELRELTDRKLLFWIEAMSLLGDIRQCKQNLVDLEKDVKVKGGMQEFLQLISELKEMVSMFITIPGPRMTPHLYFSVLALWNNRSSIAHIQGYFNRLPRTLKRPVNENRACKQIILVSSPVYSVAFSPDGSRIVSGSDGRTVRVWDAQNGDEVLPPLEGHSAMITSVTFSPDGSRIVSGSNDHTVRVWDAQNGVELFPPLRGHSDWVTSVAFSPDGSHVVSGSHDNTVRVWDAQSGDEVLPPLEGHIDAVTSVAFSPDGSRVVSGSYDNTVRVWDAQSGDEVLPPLDGHSNWVTSVAFSPDGSRIVSGSYDHTVRVWDAQTGDEVLPPLEGHSDLVNSVAFSPDGSRIVSGSDDDTVRVWDAQSGDEVLPPLEGHSGSVHSVAFSSDGSRISSGSDDNTICVWDAQSGDEVLPPLEGHSDWVRSVTFSSDGSRIVSGSDDHTVRVWDAQSGDEVLPPLEGHSNWVTSVAFSPDGSRIVSGSDDHTVRVWDAQSGDEVLPPLEGHSGSVHSVAFSLDGSRISSGSDDNTICVWDAQTGVEILPPLEGHSNMVMSVAFSPDGSRIVSGSFDNTLRVWDAQSGVEVLPPLKGHSNWVTSVAFSPDGSRVVSGSYDHTVRVWDAQTGVEILPPLEGHSARVMSVAFSPDGSRIVSGSSDNTVRVWDAQSGIEVLPPLEGHSREEVRSVAFSPDGSRIVSGSFDNTLRVWDAQSGVEVLPPLKGHSNWVTSVAFSPDGSRIVSGSGDYTVRVWGALSGDKVVPPLEGRNDWATSVAFSPDSSRTVSGSGDHIVRVWDTQNKSQMGVTSQQMTAFDCSPPLLSQVNEDTSSFPPDESNWRVQPDGWVVASPFRCEPIRKLLWLPPGLRTVVTPFCEVIISRRGHTKLDMTDVVFGDQWAKCYIG